jgi:hypothetical protein
MVPARYDLTVLQGSTLQRRFALRDPNGNTLNVMTAGAGYTIGKATIRDKIGGTVILELTTANGGVSLIYEVDSNGVFWSGFIYAPAEVTAALSDWGDGIWNLEISDGLHTYRIFEGTAKLSPEVSI